MADRRGLAVTVALALTAFAVGAWGGARLTVHSTFAEVPAHPIPPSLLVRDRSLEQAAPLLDCLLRDPAREVRLALIRSAVLDLFERQRAAGALEIGSVYFRDLEAGVEFGIDDEQSFVPASLVKIPLLMAALVVEESNPGYMDRPLAYRPQPAERDRQRHRPNVDMVPGVSYSLWRYAEAMIVESDNNATNALADLFSPDDLAEVFAALGTARLAGHDLEALTARQMGGLFRLLFDATFLSAEMSERVLALGGRSTFREGLVAGLPRQTKASHKFGEFIGELGGKLVTQLHDCGVIYAPKGPYVLCVMTRGDDIATLSKVVAEVSRIVYDGLDEARRP